MAEEVALADAASADTRSPSASSGDDGSIGPNDAAHCNSETAAGGEGTQDNSNGTENGEAGIGNEASESARAKRRRRRSKGGSNSTTACAPGSGDWNTVPVLVQPAASAH
ncbi:unnamed protein product [Phaeothamnion confervicola]